MKKTNNAQIYPPTAVTVVPNTPYLDKVSTWQDPTPEMLATPEFEAVWQCIKRWDINVPDVYQGYEGANGNHVRAILDALTATGRGVCPTSLPIDEVMSALSDAFPSPRTSRDCVVEKNLRDILAHRAVRLISSSSEAERTAAPVVQR